MSISDESEQAGIEHAREAWEAGRLKAELETRGEWKKEFQTHSGLPVKGPYTPLDLKEKGHTYLDNVGFPGLFPYTRGHSATMYRGVPPRQFVYSGFASAEATNERYRYLLQQGAKEFIVALDLPTQIGLDSDDPLGEGEVGKIGVPVDSLADMETIFDGIRLDQVFAGCSANAVGPIFLSLLLAVAKKQGLAPNQLHLLVQNDVLKEFIARGAYIFPPKHAVKFSVDVVEYVARQGLSDLYAPIMYCGYHMREAGANVIQEMAFTLADAVEYIEELLRRGISINDLPAPRGLFVAGTDIFEEVCKHRAFRRMWARTMKERFGATNPRVMALTYSVGSQASQYTAQQPMNNVVRGTIQALVEVLSGIQAINIAAYDEALSIPTEESATLALRTLQIVSNETGVPNTVDPLAGSYYVEALTDELEERATKLFQEVQSLGGAAKCIQSGYLDKQIAREAYEEYKRVKTGERVVIGVNQFQDNQPVPVNLTKFDAKEEERQIEKVKRLRRERDNAAVEKTLKGVKEAALEGVNMVEPIMAAVEVYATVGEICGTLRTVYGEYVRPVY